ncbi:MAG TPA: type I DNA topoisomerase [Candidatus Copromorpha excrementigallinarum]|uniref:DNA topoisomerase 1 n=1 Tax=Candidatus Allocopromorpha excrementigallinarum TaxID=2840742 RepID=A0A9D1I1D1_9FIRM|nr:type I DNA topoisomerase [Candidatus Copromorpha excrementigallinarum]
MAAAKKILVIVESPSKAKTIGKFLGSRYKVIASVGHVRDLPKSKMGIDIENDFEPQYISIRGKGDIIKELKKEAKSASKVYLATDPDREGEAISWHLAFLLGIDQNTPCRIVFNEITEKAIKEAIKHPRPIDARLVDAQQARRVLDRLVGYKISPLLWRKVRRGLSAGRVQSAALKIICDRENEIKNFKPQEFWTITAQFKKKKLFSAKLAEYKGKKLEIENREQNDGILQELEKGAYEVAAIEEKDRMRRPAAPFTTSSLQQDAANKLNFSTRKTMLVAQQLYEGIEIKGRGTIGLVSYIRTDSVRISDEAKAAAKEYITASMGEKYYGNNVYTNKKKDVQDAHEAIRPSQVSLEPEAVKDSLNKDQYNLYKLIWTRFLASQMSAARFKAMSVSIENGDYTFRASGSKLIFDGFLKVYSSSGYEEDKLLPDLEKGEALKLVKVEGEQNFTQPPARFTEASLVKDLEEKDIGRPSTYAPIVATLIDRKYISREKKSLIPTELGFIVTDMMEDYFKEIVDAGFTAQMEENLDDIEVKGVRWKSVIEDFYKTLEKELEAADKEIQKVEFEEELTGETCEKCGRPMVVKHGRFGAFAACTGYPECKNTKPIVQKIDVKCPKCGRDIVARRSKKGRLFYGCSGYPECTQSYWNKPVNKKCPKCGSLLVEKKTKNSKYACSNSECDYKE